jgi:hypothetical protein
MLEAPARAAAGPSRKPKADFYTVLLVIALLAVIIAIVFLWLEMSAYEYKSKGAPMASVQRSEFSGQKVVDGRPWFIMGVGAGTPRSPLARG